MRYLKGLVLVAAFVFLCGFKSSGGAGGGSGASTTQGIGGGATNTLGADSVANVKNYGAKADYITAYDGAVPALVGNTGTSTAPSSLGVTTVVNNEVLLSIQAVGATYSAVPSTPTQRANVAFVNGASYGIWYGDQVVATPTTTAANTGTIGSSTGWGALSLPLIPKSGQTITLDGVTTNSNAGGSSLQLTVPTTSNGHTLLACMSSTWGATVTAPTGWVLLTPVIGLNGNPGVRCYGRVANSEPANYTWSCSSACFPSGFMESRANVAAIDDPLTSASAAFNASSVGKLVCVDGASTNSQTCGTVAALISATSVALSYPQTNATASAISSEQYAYCSDDEPAFIAAVNALTHGGTVYIPAGDYCWGSALTYAGNYSINFVGNGPTWQDWHYTLDSSNGTGPVKLPSSTTGIYAMTTGLTQGVLTLGKAPNTNWTQSAMISGISFVCGVGFSRTGGGNDGLDFIGIQHIDMENVNVSNCAGSNINVLSTGASPGVWDWRNIRSQYAGVDGLTVAGGQFQNLQCDTCEFEDANNYGINIIAGGDNYVFIDSIFQNNNAAGTVGAQLGGGPGNGDFVAIGCWFDGTTGAIFATAQKANWAGSVIIAPHELNAQTLITYSAAGTAIPAATNYRHRTACVTDSTACTSGTTYTSGGATTCLLQSDGTNWKETGATNGCY